MLRLLADTCVLLDAAKDHRQENTLSVLEELIRRGEVSVDSLRPTRIHVAILVYLAVSFATGVALSRSNVHLNASLHIWLGALDQLGSGAADRGRAPRRRRRGSRGA